MCFRDNDADPTQQPIRITQTTESGSDQPLQRSLDKAKGGNKKAWQDTQTTFDSSTNEGKNHPATSAGNEENLKSPVVDRKALRNKYNSTRSGSSGKTAGLAFDLTV